MKINLLKFIAALLLVCNSVQAQFNPRPNWKDSYRINGLCFCITDTGSAFDHGITRKTVEINGRDYGVREVCLALRNHPDWVDFRVAERDVARYNYIPYNDIQCGNGPANNAPDEAGCPGRVDIGSAGCNEIGPGWDFAWLSRQPQFQRNGNGGGPVVDNDADADLGIKDERGTGGSGAGEGPQSVLDFPTKNKRFTAPATFMVRASATDADGVESATLSINGRVISTKTSQPFRWRPRALRDIPYQKYNNQSTIFIQVDIKDTQGNITSVDSLVYIDEDTSNTGNTDAPIGSVISIKPVTAASSNHTFDFLSARFNQNGTLRANQPAEGQWERFTVENGNTGYVTIKAKRRPNDDYKYLVVSGNKISATGTDATASGAQFEWISVNAANKTFGLKSVLTNKYVQLPQNRNKNAAVLNVRGAARGTWELFEYNVISSAKNINASTLINENGTSDLGIQINTNPTNSGFIGLSNANGSAYSMSTITGELVESGTVSNNFIDVSNLSSGVYLVVFVKEGQKQVEKVIIE